MIALVHIYITIHNIEMGGIQCAGHGQVSRRNLVILTIEQCRDNWSKEEGVCRRT